MPALNESDWISRKYKLHELNTVLAEVLRSVKSEFYDEASPHFDFYRFALSDMYHEFVHAARALSRFDPLSIDSDSGKIAFWLNTYNALVIHAVVRNKISSNLKEAKSFFHNSWLIGGFELTLDDIEHGILRGNRRAPMTLRKPFGSGDPRNKFVLADLDPRIHCAFYSACNSSPTLEIYSASSLTHQLDINARVYINKNVRVALNEKILACPKVFDWYESDFGTSENIRLFVAKYISDELTRVVLKSLDVTFSFEFTAFDWTMAGSVPPQHALFDE